MDKFKTLHNEMIKNNCTVKILGIESKYLPINLYLHLVGVVNNYKKQLKEVIMLDGKNRYKLTHNTIIEVN